MSKVIGIDIATTFSCCAVYEGGKPTVIINQEGDTSTPSVVAFDKDGSRKVGKPALRQAITNPKNTIHSAKRLIGRKYDECADDLKNLAYEVINDNGLPRIKVNEKVYSPEEITAAVVQKLKLAAEDYLGQEVKQCVITVPAMFDDSQRTSTKLAAEACGLEVLRVINEPTAACLAAHIDKDKKDKKVVVADFGGGTEDISVIDYSDGVYEILASKGNSHLGGNDFDWAIMNWLIDEFKKENDVDLSKDPMALQRIKDSAEKAKIELSSSNSTEINIPYITANADGPKHLVQTLTRSQFERIVENLIQAHKEPCMEALNAAGLKADDIDEVVMVGGTSRIPALQNMIKEVFGDKINKSANFDTAIAEGAAIQGAILNGDDSVGDVVLLDVTPLSLGIETQGGVLTTIVEANTTIPCKKTMTFSNATDMQPNASIVIFSGNRPMAYQNKMLGQFNIELTPSPKGMNQIEVSFDIDANGILTVSAIDKALNKEGKITIESSSSLTPEEIERMKSDAEANAEADKKLKEEAEKFNQADGFAFSIEKTLKDMGDKVSEDEKNSINPILENLKKAVAERNVADCEKYQKELEEKWTPIVQKMYSNTSGATANQFSGSNPFGFTGDPTQGFDPNAFSQPTPTAEPTKTASDFEEVK